LVDAKLVVSTPRPIIVEYVAVNLVAQYVTITAMKLKGGSEPTP